MDGTRQGGCLILSTCGRNPLFGLILHFVGGAQDNGSLSLVICRHITYLGWLLMLLAIVRNLKFDLVSISE